MNSSVAAPATHSKTGRLVAFAKAGACVTSSLSLSNGANVETVDCGAQCPFGQSREELSQFGVNIVRASPAPQFCGAPVVPSPDSASFMLFNQPLEAGFLAKAGYAGKIQNMTPSVPVCSFHANKSAAAAAPHGVEVVVGGVVNTPKNMVIKRVETTKDHVYLDGVIDRKTLSTKEKSFIGTVRSKDPSITTRGDRQLKISRVKKDDCDVTVQGNNVVVKVQNVAKAMKKTVRDDHHKTYTTLAEESNRRIVKSLVPSSRAVEVSAPTFSAKSERPILSEIASETPMSENVRSYRPVSIKASESGVVSESAKPMSAEMKSVSSNPAVSVEPKAASSNAVSSKPAASMKPTSSRAASAPAVEQTESKAASESAATEGAAETTTEAAPTSKAHSVGASTQDESTA